MNFNHHVSFQVGADTLVVERVKFEEGSAVGGMQSMCWIMRFSGNLVGLLGGGWLLHYASFSEQVVRRLDDCDCRAWVGHCMI